MALKRIPDKDISAAIREQQQLPKGVSVGAWLGIGMAGANKQLEADQAQIPAIERAAMERGRKEVAELAKGIFALEFLIQTKRGNTDGMGIVNRIKDRLQARLKEWSISESELLGKAAHTEKKEITK